MVSCYVIKREKVTVIDCVNASSISQQDLSEAFQEINIHPSTVDQVILTHGHMDHIGALVAEKPLFGNEVVIACEGLRLR
jgi:glyoxylase-like metal-dependent hydrolase (beta-lactamase superfamily II)